MREERISEIQQRLDALAPRSIIGTFTRRDGSINDEYVYVDAAATLDFHDHAQEDVIFLLGELDRLNRAYNQIRKDCPDCGRLISDHRGTECQ